MVPAASLGVLDSVGFAGGLTLTGLPQGPIPLALLIFNLGVEIGQLGFVLLVLALGRSIRSLETHWPRTVEALPGYAIGTPGAFWTIQRVALMWGGAR